MQRISKLVRGKTDVCPGLPVGSIQGIFSGLQCFLEAQLCARLDARD